VSEPTITDEELAATLEWIERYDGDIAGAVAPIVAALRAERAEVERLRRQASPSYSVTYSGGAKGMGSLVTDSFDEAVRAIVAAARGGCLVHAELDDS
jgi:hypothetical protein